MVHFNRFSMAWLPCFLVLGLLFHNYSLAGQYYSHQFNSGLYGGVSYDEDYQAVLDYASTQGITAPSTTNQGCQNDLVVNLKNDGLWDHIELLYVFAGSGNEDFAELNFEDPGNHTITQNGTVNFTNADGFEKNGSNNTDYLDTNWDQVNDCVNCGQNDIAVGGWVIPNADPPVNGQFNYLFGAATSGNGLGFVYRNIGSTQIWTSVNSAATLGSNRSGALTGHTIQLYRNASGTKYYQEDDNAEASSSNNSNGESSNDIVIFGLNVGSILACYGSVEMSIFYVGDHTGTNSDYDLMHDHFTTYMGCIDN